MITVERGLPTSAALTTTTIVEKIDTTDDSRCNVVSEIIERIGSTVATEYVSRCGKKNAAQDFDYITR